jgi:soluble cytochrome b562
LRDTIFDIIKEVPNMPNAKDYVNQSMSSVQNTVNTLQQALSNAEKTENKNKIQQAINSLNSVQDQLSGYRD